MYIWWAGQIGAAVLFTLVGVRLNRLPKVSSNRDPQVMVDQAMPPDGAPSTAVVESQSPIERAEDGPNFVHALTGSYFTATGFYFMFVPEAVDGVFVLNVFYQNSFEKPCRARVELHHHWKPLRQCLPAAMEIDCAGGAFGVARYPLALPKDFQNKVREFEVYGRAIYQEGLGRRIHLAGGLGSGVPISASSRSWIATLGNVALAMAGVKLPASLQLKLPGEVAEVLPANVRNSSAVLWRPGDAVDIDFKLPEVQSN